MSTILTTLAKELMSYFFSPVAYVIAVLFYLFRGLEVHGQVRAMAALGADRDLFSTVYMISPSSNFMVVLVPAILTMRCFAEERRSGSLEVLMTAPVREREVVLGKWLAALVFFAVLWLPTLPLLLLLNSEFFLAQDLPYGPVLTGYLGLTLLGAFLLAVGCWTSSLTDNQLLASLTAMLFNTALLVGPDMLGQQLGAQAQEWPWHVLLDQTRVRDHLVSWFCRGLVDTAQLTFYLGGAVFFLFLTTKSLEARRWR
ncbi:MAG: ABC transporter permease subunit [Planctomycetes bacterium]|nr:ABC transporter permease subunit [Planctomycetota bacterium]